MRVLFSGDPSIKHRLDKLRKLPVGDVFNSHGLVDVSELLNLP